MMFEIEIENKIDFETYFCVDSKLPYNESGTLTKGKHTSF